MDEPLAYLNGRLIPASDASISLVDTGFVMGAAVAEQLRTFGGELFRLRDHLARLEQSLQIVEVDPGATREQLARTAGELVRRNHRLVSPGDDLGLSIFVTPGVHPTYAPSDVSPQPTLAMHTYLLPFRLWARKYTRGQTLVTTRVEQTSPRTLPPGLKCRSRMHYYLADRQAARIEPGARALMLDREGLVTEASTANIVIFRSGEGLLSPPLEKVLRGISLEVVGELAEQLGIPLAQRDLTPADVSSADEVFLTSTPLCLVPVTRFDGRPIGDGTPGEVFGRLLSAWSELAGLDIAAQAVRFSNRS